MNKVYRVMLVLIITFFYSCKQKFTNTEQESSLPSLENGNWRYTKNDVVLKSGKYIDGYKIGSWKYRINNEVQNLYWFIYENSQIKVNHPKSWRITDNGEYLFYSIVNKEKGDFFIIKRQNKKEINLNLDSYFNEAVTALSGSNIGHINNYACVRLEYEKRNAYYLSLDVEKENLKSAYYIFYTEDNDSIYDITFKVNGENEKINKEIFAGMVYSINIKGEKLFHNDDELTASKEIKIEDLY